MDAATALPSSASVGSRCTLILAPSSLEVHTSLSILFLLCAIIEFAASTMVLVDR